MTEPLDDDTYLKRTLGAALLGAREIVGWERYTECLRRLNRSDELAVASCLEAAEALAALGIRKEDVRDRERKEALKAAKKAARDILLWRCTGNSLGLDSREALVRAFEEAVRLAAELAFAPGEQADSLFWSNVWNRLSRVLRAARIMLAMYTGVYGIR